MLDINTLPNQTESDRAIILRSANGIIWSIIGVGVSALSCDDIDDLHSHALEAANRAVEKYVEGGEATLATLITRYVLQARRDYMRRRGELNGRTNNKQEAFEHGTVSLEGMEIESREREGRDAAISAMEITIDMARNDGVIDDREYQVLTMRRGGVIQREIGEELGICPQRVHQIQGDAVRKIRARYRTAE